MMPTAVFITLISGSPTAGFYPTQKVFCGIFRKKLAGKQGKKAAALAREAAAVMEKSKSAAS